MPVHYKISKETVDLILDALRENMFGVSDDGDEYNNDDVIAALDALNAEIEQKSDKKQFITIVKTEQAGTVIHDFYTAAFHARHLIVVEGIIVYPQSFANQINGLTEFEFISAKKEATAQQAA